MLCHQMDDICFTYIECPLMDGVGYKSVAASVCLKFSHLKGIDSFMNATVQRKV